MVSATGVVFAVVLSLFAGGLVVGVVAAAVLLTRSRLPDGAMVAGLRKWSWRTGVSRRIGLVAAGALAAGALGLLPLVVLLGREPVLVVSGVLYGVGVFVGATAASNLPRYRALRTAEETSAGDVTEGPVAVSGTVQPAGTISAPFSGTAVAAYTYVIATWLERVHPKKEVDAAPAGSWTVLDFGTERTGFAVEDDTGRVLVDPTDAWLSLPSVDAPTTTATSRRRDGTDVAADHDRVVAAGERLPDGARRLIRSESTNYALPDGGTTDRPVRLAEHTLEPGDSVVVVGRAEQRRTDDGRAVTVVTGDDPHSSFVARGTLGEVRAGLDRSVRRNGLLAAGALVASGVTLFVGLPL